MISRRIRKRLTSAFQSINGRKKVAAKKRRKVARKSRSEKTDNVPVGRRLSIVCFPKSGSTFITKSLCDYTAFKQYVIATSAEVQELSTQKLDAASKNPSFIAQTHCLPTKHALKMHQHYKMDTVFIYRNVMDCLVSLRDMYVERVETGEGIWQGDFTSQWGIYNNNFLKLDESEKLDVMIECALGWYLLFYSAWQKKIYVEDYPATVIRYEDFFADSEKNFFKLVDDLDLRNEEVAKAFALPEKRSGAEGVRFNVGRTGRGSELLSDAQKKKILSKARIIEKATGSDLSPILDYDS